MAALDKGRSMSEYDVGNSGERMVAGKNDWGYFAHLSIYRFFSEFAAGKKILEIGSGTGYGANHLAAYARRIVSLDVDEAANAFCRSRYGSDRLEFRLHDLSQSAIEGENFDLIVSSNALEHISPIDQLIANTPRC
jgi:cyclopropane fatty-acyl-phospholipid synthase-like methyltransferase